MQENELNQLLPEIKNVIEFVGGAVAGGIVGNRADSWFVNLYYHQKQRLLAWLNSWIISEEDRVLIEGNEDIKILFSHVTSSVADEIFEKKLLMWPSITESLLRNKNFEFNEKQYFISIFMKLDPFAIHYLARLEVHGPIDVNRVFPMDRPDSRPELGSEDFPLFLGQLQNATNGMIAQISDKEKVVFKISELGSRFVDFISNSSQEKIREMAQ